LNFILLILFRFILLYFICQLVFFYFITGSKVYLTIRFGVFFLWEIVQLFQAVDRFLTPFSQQPPSYRNGQGESWRRKWYFGCSPGGP